MQKTITLGRCNSQGTHGTDPGDVTVTLELRVTPKGEELSITGEVWQRNKRDCVTCGQIQDSIMQYLTFTDQLAFGITREAIAKLLRIWDTWHLNGMRAECEHQRARGETWATHPSAPCPDCGYKLGHAWLFEALPDDVRSTVLHWISSGIIN